MTGRGDEDADALTVGPRAAMTGVPARRRSLDGPWTARGRDSWPRRRVRVRLIGLIGQIGCIVDPVAPQIIPVHPRMTHDPNVRGGGLHST